MKTSPTERTDCMHLYAQPPFRISEQECLCVYAEREYPLLLSIHRSLPPIDLKLRAACVRRAAVPTDLIVVACRPYEID